MYKLLFFHFLNKSFHQIKGDVGMHNVKIHGNKCLHSKMTCVTPERELCREGLCMIVLSSCYEDSGLYDFSHCGSLHHPSFDEMIFSLVALIFSKEVVLFSSKWCIIIHSVEEEEEEEEEEAD